MSGKWIFFDCDSTLSAIEGVDELARLRPPEVFEEVVALTDKAMNGEIAIEDIFGARLDIIRPGREECEAVGKLYVDQIEPTAEATLEALREMGWKPVIVSGGFVPTIRPLAKLLGIERIEAIDLDFAEDGSYAGFDQEHPNTRNGGKLDVVRKLRSEHAIERAVAVGDGISDLETKPGVDLFVGFGGYAEREAVKSKADFYIKRLEELVPIIEARDASE